MSRRYFTDREIGPRPRIAEEIPVAVWGGFVALASSLITNGAFGVDFPADCPDGLGPTGTHEHTMGLALSAEVPDVSWPLRADSPPPTPAILDFIEFCYEHVSEPSQGTFHSFFSHYHLDFDREAGQRQLCEKINRIFARNGLAYESRDNGEVIRLAAPVIREELTSTTFETGDAQLDQLLENARTKFLSPNRMVRREALEKLWDAWERIKTIEIPEDKKASIGLLLDQAASETNFRTLLENEACELTRIGNSFQIRHSETSQILIERDLQVDYVFHRLFAMIQLLLRSRRQAK